MIESIEILLTTETSELFGSPHHARLEVQVMVINRIVNLVESQLQ